MGARPGPALKLRLICVGRLSSSYLREGVADFSGRIERYLPFETVELKEEKGGTKTNPERIKQLEGERILERIGPQEQVIVLDEKGRSLTSVKLAGRVEQHMLHGTATLTAVIGGAYGLSDAVRQRAELVLSLSSFTLTHQMARLFWLEQLYRSLTIIRKEPYHNA